MVEWRPVAGHQGYHVSRCGKVRGPSGRILRPYTAHPRGYPHLVYFKVGLWSGKRERRHAYVHRLVCEAFHGPPPPGYTDCAHLDHDPANNHADNLSWSTHADNMREVFSEEAAERRAVREEEFERCGAPDGDVPF